MLKAAIDIGSNTVRLLIAACPEEGGPLRVVAQRVEATRLAQGINNACLQEGPMGATVDVLRDYCALAAAMGVSVPVMAATSAVRDAFNKERFLQLAKEATGHDVMVLSGEEEAAMSFLGASRSLPRQDMPVLVMDAGGGSTELIYEDWGRAVGRSADVGSVRAMEAAWGKDRIKKILAALVAGVPHKKYRLVGCGGTITAAAAVLKNLETYTRSAVHGTKLSKEEITAFYQRLLLLAPAERLQQMPLLAGREDIMEYGMLIIITMMELLDQDEIWVSDAGLLDGLLLAGDGLFSGSSCR